MPYKQCVFCTIKCQIWGQKLEMVHGSGIVQLKFFSEYTELKRTSKILLIRMVP